MDEGKKLALDVAYYRFERRFRRKPEWVVMSPLAHEALGTPLAWRGCVIKPTKRQVNHIFRIGSGQAQIASEWHI